MKFFKNVGILFLLLGLMSCQEDDLTLDTIVVPSNLNVTTDISDDGSGLVVFNATADDAITYKYNFSDGTSAVAPGGNYTKRFTRTGLNTYLVTVVAYGTGGVSSSKTVEVEVRSDYDDPETKLLLTGGDTKTWYVASAVDGHLAVGPNVAPEPGGSFDTSYFSAVADFGPDCFYEDKMVFSQNASGDVFYNYNNENSAGDGVTFFNWQYTAAFGGSGAQYSDECLPYSPDENVGVTLAPSESGIPEGLTTGTVLNLNGDTSISYYVGQTSYEVLQIDENNMYLRAVQGNDPGLAWYIRLTTDPNGGGSTGVGTPEEEAFQTEFETLKWEADFENETSLDSETWNYELGNNDGWGNNESQYYTDNNTSIVDGKLLITAKKESESGFDYTSSRITTKDKFEFTYGRVEVSAKLPVGGGTWPAIWMLGNNYEEVGWPTTGEIDIMEQNGNDPNTIHGTLHYPGASGGNADGGTTTIQNPSSEFHTYTMEWSEERIIFLVDGEVYHTYENNADSPFNKDFYLILNVAMGGTFGGEIASDFTESSLEVEYIKVYQ